MNWEFALMTLALFAAALICTALALFAWQRRLSAWGTPFAILMLATAEWALGYALELSATDPAVKMFWAEVQYLGKVTVPVVWFLFAVRYTGQERWLDRSVIAVLSIIPVVTFLLALTNESHGLIWQSVTLQRVGPFTMLETIHGRWFWVHTAYFYLLLLGGTLYLFRALQQFGTRYQWQFLILLLSPMLPWLSVILALLNISSIVRQDLMPLALTGSGLILGWGILRHHLFDLVPVAHRSVIDSMGDGILVTSASGQIINANPAASNILGLAPASLSGQQLPSVLPEWQKKWNDADAEQIEAEMVVPGEEDDTHYYDLRISPLRDGRSRVSGRLVVLRDITARKRAEIELRKRKELFENLVAVARATAEGPSLEATLQNALNVTTLLTEAEYGSLFLLDRNKRVTHSILARGSASPADRQHLVGQVMDQGLAGWVVAHQQLALIHDTLTDKRWLTLPDQPYTVRSVLGVPITTGTEVPGVLTLQHSHPYHFKAEDADLMQAASDQMSLAVRNAQIYEQQRRLAERQAILYEALRTIGSHLDPGTVLKLAVRTLSTLTEWPGIAILVPDADEQMLVVEAAAGLLADASTISLPARENVSGLVFVSGETQLVEDVGRNGQGIGHFLEQGTVILAPLHHAQRRLGVMLVASDSAHALTTDDLWLADSLARGVSLAMANARLFETINEQHSRLRALIASSRDGIVLIGVNRQVLVVNRTALNYLGLKGGPEEWMQRTVMDALLVLRRQAPNVVRAALQELRRVEQANGEIKEGEFAVAGRFLRWVNLPVQSEALPLGRLIVLQDVTRERTLQQMRDDLTHTMVHDLRNPLNIVSSALAMMEDRLEGITPPDYDQMMEIARESTGRMLGLVNGILSISRLENGYMPLLRRPIQPEELIIAVLKNQSPLAKKKKIRLTREVEENLPVVLADRGLIDRVLQNLIGNAIKFTPPEGVVEVQAWADEKELFVRVEDSGPGVPVQIQDQLFQKFVTGKQAEKGTGLGLAFCRMAIEAHGGRIWAEHEPGQGAVFVFVLPTEHQQAAEEVLEEAIVSVSQ